MAQLKGTSGLLELDPQVEPRASDVQVPVSVVLGRSENRGNLWLYRRCHRCRRPRSHRPRPHRLRLRHPLRVRHCRPCRHRRHHRAPRPPPPALPSPSALHRHGRRRPRPHRQIHRRRAHRHPYLLHPRHRLHLLHPPPPPATPTRTSPFHPSSRALCACFPRQLSPLLSPCLLCHPLPPTASTAPRPTRRTRPPAPGRHIGRRGYGLSSCSLGLRLADSSRDMRLMGTSVLGRPSHAGE